jgi:phosphonatase-like hydrolase
MINPVDLFVFDIAGTTVVDQDQVLRAFIATADAFRVPVRAAVLRERMGWHKLRVFEQTLEECGADRALAPAMAQRFEQEYAATLRQTPVRPTPGALETLRELDDRGVRIAFNTGFSRETANMVLAAAGFAHWPSVASDEVDAGRPAPSMIRRAMELCAVRDPKRVGVVGDTPSDLAAAAAAGAGFIIGVGCGTHTLAELAPHRHTHLLNDLRELPQALFGRG